MGSFLVATAAFALVGVVGWGIARTVTGGQYGFSMAFLVAGALFLGVLIWLIVRERQSGTSQTIIVSTDQPRLRHGWTPEHVIQLAAVVVPALSAIWGKSVQPAPQTSLADSKPISPPVAPSLPAPGSSEPPATVPPRARQAKPERSTRGRFKKLDAEFAAVQQKLGLPEQQARLMRNRVFASVPASAHDRRQSPYPPSISARTMQFRIEFARLIREYMTARSRGAEYCASVSARIFPRVRDNRIRGVVAQIEETLAGDYTADELLVFCMHDWQFSGREIAAKLGISVSAVDRALYDVRETIARIEELTRGRLLAETGILYDFKLAPVFMQACTEWVPGLRAVKKEAS